jgi:T-complex protein 1 subunit eta
MIGIKKIAGGALQDTLFIDGVAFKKTFSYAGFEQQPKNFQGPKVLCLNVELELKAEKDNAEVRIDAVQVTCSAFIFCQPCNIFFNLGLSIYC